MPRAKADELRRKWHILVDGDDVPPPARDFRDLRLPEPILRKLREKGTVQPTPIQVQGLPVVLSGRDMIGIGFTGSGKMLVFVLPLMMVALQEETMMPIVPGEGPFGMIICPSWELAKQTYDVIEQFLVLLKEAGCPEIRPLLRIGGVDMRGQLDVVKKGVHIAVATPGRLKDLLAKKKMNLDNCSKKYIGRRGEDHDRRGERRCRRRATREEAAASHGRKSPSLERNPPRYSGGRRHRATSRLAAWHHAARCCVLQRKPRLPTPWICSCAAKQQDEKNAGGIHARSSLALKIAQNTSDLLWHRLRSR